jgi:hypothetical protein
MPDGSGKLLIMRDRNLEARVKSFDFDEGFDSLLSEILKLPSIYHALRDLTDAISIPHMMAPRCASAIETLRVFIASGNSNRQQSWLTMQQALRVSEGFLKAITEHSKGPRHGDHHYIPGTTTEVIAYNSWIVMDRFLEYLKRSKQPLPESEFPLLS